jgi:GMP synthase-like glutamine amidotransferase
MMKTYTLGLSLKKKIKEAIESDKTILGIWLCGKLIASSMGADVYRNAEKGVGRHAITKTDSCATWMPDTLDPLSFHYDCFEVPDGAIPFASSAITQYQCFKLGENIWALQFHLEAQDNTVSSFLALGDEGLPLGEYVQSRQAIYYLLE